MACQGIKTKCAMRNQQDQEKYNNGRVHTSVATNPGNQIEREAEPNLASKPKPALSAGARPDPTPASAPATQGATAREGRLQAPNHPQFPLPNRPRRTSSGGPPHPRASIPRDSGANPARRWPARVYRRREIGDIFASRRRFFSPARAVAEEEMLLLSIAAPPLDGGGF
jgi:hypothetical protein